MRTGPVYWKARRILRGLRWSGPSAKVRGPFIGQHARLSLAAWMVNRGRKPKDHVHLARIESQGRTIKAILVQHKLGMIREMKVYR